MSFRREKFVPHGGPDGGDGGRGASVVLEADAGVGTLGGFRDRRHFRAPSGGPGESARRHGGDAGDLVLRVPVGTVASDCESGDVLADLVAAGDRVVVAEGGRGGRGNARFATSTRQAPRIGELGAPGVRRRVHLELRLIADVGLVGLPNAGKSTLLAALTGATPKIAAYPFTTLTPNLGVAEDAGGRTFVVADVPGLIEGAASGAGLGHDFLRHLERTRLLLHLVDVSGGAEAAEAALATVRRELAAFSAALATKPEIVVATKLDLPEAEAAVEALLERAPGLAAISAVTGDGIAELMAAAGARVVAERGRGTGTVSSPAVAASGHRVYRHRSGAAGDLAVSREGAAWRVSGKAVERAVTMTDLDSSEAVAALHRRFRRLGVDAALAGAGVDAGDVVRIGATEFDWVPDELP